MDINLEEFIERNSWLVRPCALYDEEYSDCRSLRSRFHQHFLHGSFLDCTQWKHDHDNCVKWKEENNTDALKEIVQSEKSRRDERLKAHYENDVWEKRSEPPSDWNRPLPQWLQERDAATYLAVKSEDSKLPSQNSQNKTFCVIS